jgi:O-antigen ligase
VSKLAFSTTSLPILSGSNRARWMGIADWLAVGVAVSLPWSTTATGIFITLWLIAILPTVDIGELRRVLNTAPGLLPVLLWVLAAVGMLWADATWAERIGGLGKFHRLLLIPLLLLQFRRSEHGIWVLHAFFASVLALLIASWGLALIPGLPWRGMHQPGVPAKDYIFQSTNFLICAFALLGYACAEGRAQRWRWVMGLAALAGLFLANIFFVVTSRTALVVAPVLLLVLGWREFGWKGLVGAGLLGSIVAVAIWSGSPYLRERVLKSVDEYETYRVSDVVSSTGLHLEFLRKSVTFFESAPIIGHGTGSIGELFRKAASGQGVEAELSQNPHNQILAVAVQLGLIGAVVLVMMWVAHLLLFRAGGLTAWIGMIVVVENVVSSLFNSHLFDFTSGWLYVFGVGVAGGMMLRRRDST